MQWSIPLVISNGRIAIVVFNEKLNDAEVSFPAWEQKVINSYFIGSYVYTPQFPFKVKGYSLEYVPLSKCNNSQCLIAPAYGY